MGRGHRKNRFGVSVAFVPDRYGGRATAANMALADGMGCMIPRSRLTFHLSQTLPAPSLSILEIIEYRRTIAHAERGHGEPWAAGLDLVG